MYNEKTKKMRYVLKIGQLTTTYDNFDDFVEALREEAEDREFNRHIEPLRQSHQFIVMLDRRFLPLQRYPLTMKKGGKSFMILSPKWQQTYEEARRP